jgi:hypothetical protein
MMKLAYITININIWGAGRLYLLYEGLGVEREELKRFSVLA